MRNRRRWKGVGRGGEGVVGFCLDGNEILWNLFCAVSFYVSTRCNRILLSLIVLIFSYKCSLKEERKKN